MSSDLTFEAQMESYLSMINSQVHDSKELYTILEAAVLQSSDADSIPIMLLVLACCRSKLQNANSFEEIMADVGYQMTVLMHDDLFKEKIDYAASRVRVFDA